MTTRVLTIEMRKGRKRAGRRDFRGDIKVVRDLRKPTNRPYLRRSIQGAKINGLCFQKELDKVNHIRGWTIF